MGNKTVVAKWGILSVLVDDRCKAASERISKYAEVVSEMDGKGDGEAYLFFKSHPELLREDGKHPTDDGLRALGELWAKAFIRRFDQSPRN